MKKLILVRHASTKAIESGQLKTRQWDELLSEKGRLQATALAKRLSSIHIDAVYSSPQPRALATAIKIGRDVEIIDDLEDWRKPLETARQMHKRVTVFPYSLSRDGTFVIVSHGTPIAMLLGERVLSPPEYQASWGIVPASISVIQDGIVVAVNDTSHLDLYPETMVYDWQTWTYRNGK